MINSFSLPSAPVQSATTYVAYDRALPIVITDADYVQSPFCNYAFQVTYTWIGTNDYIYVEGAFPNQISVQSMRPADSVGPYPISVKADILVADNGGTVNDLFPHNDQAVEFTVIIEDPCTTTTILGITTFSANPLILTAGEADFVTWSDPITALDSVHGKEGLCGSYNFAVSDENYYALTSDWAIIE